MHALYIDKYLWATTKINFETNINNRKSCLMAHIKVLYLKHSDTDPHRSGSRALDLASASSVADPEKFVPDPA